MQIEPTQMQIEPTQMPIEHVNFELSKQKSEVKQAKPDLRMSKTEPGQPYCQFTSTLTAQVWVRQVKFDLSKPRCELSRPLHQLNVPASDWARSTECKVVLAMFNVHVHVHKPKCELGKSQRRLSRPDTCYTMVDLGIYKGGFQSKTMLISGTCPAYLVRMCEISKSCDLCICYFSVWAMRACYYRKSEFLLQYN